MELKAASTIAQQDLLDFVQAHPWPFMLPPVCSDCIPALVSVSPILILYTAGSGNE